MHKFITETYEFVLRIISIYCLILTLVKNVMFECSGLCRDCYKMHKLSLTQQYLSIGLNDSSFIKKTHANSC